MNGEAIATVTQEALKRGKKVSIRAGCFNDWTPIREIGLTADGLVRVIVDAPARPEVFMTPSSLGAVRVTD